MLLSFEFSPFLHQSVGDQFSKRIGDIIDLEKATILRWISTILR